MSDGTEEILKDLDEWREDPLCVRAAKNIRHQLTRIADLRAALDQERAMRIGAQMTHGAVPRLKDYKKQGLKA